MHIDGHAGEEALDLIADPFCLYPVVTGIAACKDLYTEALYLIAFHHLLLEIGSVGQHHRTLGIQCAKLVGLIILFFLICSSFGLLVCLLFWGRGNGFTPCTVYQVIDLFVLGYGYLAFTAVVLL